MKLYTYLLAIVLLSISVSAETDPVWEKLFSKAYFGHKGYDVLERLCDEAGGRMPGTEKSKKALNILKEELTEIGYDAKFEPYEMPGWFRGKDVVKMVEPTERILRAAALGYVDKKQAFTAEILDAGKGKKENFSTFNFNGKIALVEASKSSRSKVIDIAAEHGAEAVLFTNRKEGGKLLCGVANFYGDPAAIPAYSITFEEGSWLKRLLKRNVPVRMMIDTRSYVTEDPITVNNVVASLPGKKDKRVVIGAHVDSWDLGNGGVDNGQGTAVIFEIAKIMKEIMPENELGIDFVWFNAEELGLWGSRAYANSHKGDSIVAMINMDMTGSPKGFNTFGYDHFKPLLEELTSTLDGFGWEKGIVSNPWTNSDHIFFMLNGTPTINIWGHLDKPQYNYYHDFGDTFDKQNKRYIADAAAVISILTYELANNPDIPQKIMTEKETMEFMRKHELEEQLKRQGWWNFDN